MSTHLEPHLHIAHVPYYNLPISQLYLHVIVIRHFPSIILIIPLLSHVDLDGHSVIGYSKVVAHVQSNAIK